MSLPRRTACWAKRPRQPPCTKDLEGLVVDVEITSWPTPTRPPVGRVIEVLGSPDDFGVDVEMMIRKHQLPRIFPGKRAGRGARRGSSRPRRGFTPPGFS